MLEDKVKIALIGAIILCALAMILKYEQIVLLFAGALIGILVPASGDQNAPEPEDQQSKNN